MAEKKEMTEWKKGVSEWMGEMNEWKKGMEERLVRIEDRMKKVEEGLEKVDEGLQESGKKGIEERLVRIEDRMKKVEEGLGKVDEGLQESGQLCVVKQGEISARVNSFGDNLSEVVVRLEGIEVRQDVVEGTLTEIGVKQAKLDNCREEREDFPQLTKDNGSWVTVKEKPKIAKRDDGVSCADFCKNMQEGAVLLLGSSMARGVGKCLADQNLMYSTLDFSGARIENIRDKVKVIGDRPESHVVIMVGTNNLKYDDAETMLAKYRELIDELNARKYRKLSIVGILQRFDFGKFILDDKRGDL